ncbi:tRNA (adenosine(37)-N6)-dimethylallyltransferase MiaA [Ferruginibacter albus]|uniref:tRNA (adenosine(37)-N6)-dimethylallyltransferase MiaA n=1 Tax=Ferruginibacter albus TaxID=2875540 RepID=UPI001CC8295E|nr:tRNA (adenosine(37)-N6)-dimethylallyltransferase MiaA [Ferruginibacter albus]UAY51134.1 tRNA (adenosine(37)-N6)-dimethylallyltransferase MiaA [Ferruginibacter albus]
MKNKTCIIIVGPTAVGKTAIAVQLAQFLSTQIISADSRQCYKELNIGVAKPSTEELQSVKHYFINSHSINDEMNAAVFEKYALQEVRTIFENNDHAVMVGGTGLYIKAFCEGMDAMPSIDPEIRNKIITDYETKGLAWLQKQAEDNDPHYYSKGEIKNPQRLMRALEVKLSTGRSILDFQAKNKKQRDFNIIKIGLQLQKEELYERINQRVDIMINDGLVEEVKALLPYRHINALQTVGYKELFEYFDNKLSLEKAIDNIKLNTRHYAKRQMTWFKKDEEVKWNAPDFNAIQQAVIT